MFCTYFLKRCFSILFNTFSNMCYFYEGEKKGKEYDPNYCKNKQVVNDHYNNDSSKVLQEDN